MITHDQDSDVVRWGLELFESDPYSNNFNYCSGFSLDGDDGCYYRGDGDCFKQDRYDIEGGNVDSDEMIAHALQEELSQLAFDECEGGSAEEGFRDSGYSVGWIDENVEQNCGSVQDCVENDDDGGPSSSCSSPEDKLCCGDDWSYALEISNEYAIDGEVEKRLNQMVSIPHVPRINGEIPSIDEATLDHQRLLDRLRLYNLVEFKVQGDGNCQFRALSDQFYRTPKHHEFVRQEVVDQLKSTPEVYEAYVPMDYADYLEKMSRSGEWGDHVTLQAAADSYGVKIFVITSFKDTCYIEILPNVQRSERVIFLSFWAEVHYNSIYPEGDMLAFETKRKKKWRMFRNMQLESLGEYLPRDGNVRT